MERYHVSLDREFPKPDHSEIQFKFLFVLLASDGATHAILFANTATHQVKL